MSADLGLALASQRKKFVLFIFVMLLVALPLMAVLISKSVQITVNPKGLAGSEMIQITSGFVLPISGKFIVYSDRASFAVSSPGYHIQQVNFEKSSKIGVIEVKLRPLPGKVTLIIETDEAFLINIPKLGIQSSSSRIDFEAPPGDVKIELDGSKLKAVSETITITGKGLLETFVFKPETIKSMFTARFDPRETKVIVDGKPRSLLDGALSVPLAEGLHTIQASLNGYVSFKKEINILKSGNVSIGKVVLRPKDVNLFTRSKPSEAALLLDGQYIGKTPQTLTISPNRKYDLQFRKSGFYLANEVVLPTIGTDINLKVSLRKKTSPISVLVEPQASIFINDSFKGLSPMDIGVAIGDTLTLSSPGFATEKIIIPKVISKGYIIRVNLILDDRKIFVSAPEKIKIAGINFKKIERAKVELPEGFNIAVAKKIPDIYVSETLITRASYAKFMGSNGEALKSDIPQISVTYSDAAAYCNWLSRQLGLKNFYNFNNTDGIGYISLNAESNGFRLPTLTEWVYLISDGMPSSLSTFPWGESAYPIPRGIGNISGREMSTISGSYVPGYIDPFDGLSPVSAFRSSKLGIFDLVGNAREWLQNSSATSAGLLDSVNPSDPTISGSRHLIIGSSYLSARKDEFHSLRLKTGIFGEPDVGFRVVRTIK